MNKEQHNEFMEVVAKPMVFTALSICVFCVLVDYSFQLIEAIDILVSQ